MEVKKPVKIAVFGGAQEPKQWTPLGWPTKERRLAEDLGTNLGVVFGDKIEILTGACVGIPDIVANYARKYGTKVIGYSGEQTKEAHMRNPNYVDPTRLDEIIFSNPNDVVLNGLTERSLRMMRDSDALVYLGGRTGTLTEYFAAFDGCNKPMYVLNGSGGVIDRIPKLKIRKQRKSGIIHNTNSVFGLISRIDEDFKICNFQNDTDVLVIHGVSPLSWVEFAYLPKSLSQYKKIIVRD